MAEATAQSKLSKDIVMNVLKNCHDPEIPVNIVDLGLIYDVGISDGNVLVKMTLTTQGCHAGDFLAYQIKSQIEALEGVKSANVELVWDPPWNPIKISKEGMRQLKELGIF